MVAIVRESFVVVVWCGKVEERRVVDAEVSWVLKEVVQCWEVERRVKILSSFVQDLRCI